MSCASLCIVVVGAPTVGKSSVSIQFVQREFITYYDPTIMEAYRRQEVIGHETVMLDIIDTAGQDEFVTMMHPYFRKADGFLFVFSVVNRETFQHLVIIRDEVLRVKDTKSVPAVLVANKTDLQNERTVPEGEGRQFAQHFFRDHHVPYIETSAKMGTNIVKAFHTVVNEIKEQKRQESTFLNALSKGRRLSQDWVRVEEVEIPQSLGASEVPSSTKMATQMKAGMGTQKKKKKKKGWSCVIL